ncbi:hypothetical protein TBLA_0C02440 [Henningerozyma blattae CBS 6284]|uniref:Mitochondrial import receptor subunit TOM20 n=1 Tax=Henningerozyma blattae (strain ATCC 34711 / CBS 6284 / DSM 70876 / NBRC 10599 / NRRL Y-10934 / UCD 77-7) TaxID=1071380 RepID=I2H102_HENB6|nr:hypothetical protein TBLA_0C02440 [Tetrapisispora blattae CBS 6284]CCH60054.1 hypothetical protein TBLA_0C02440 [Tetrapisispora blattae CBS 6284]
MSTNSFSRILSYTSAIVALSATGYALYFDHKRRSSPEFRRQIKLQNKKYKELLEEEQENAKQEKLENVGRILTSELVKDPLPTDPAQREMAFAANVELGEKLAIQPGKELEAACKFYKALTVYPNPADLLGIYQKTVSDEIYEYIVMMIAILPPSSLSPFLGGPASDAARINEIVE